MDESFSVQTKKLPHVTTIHKMRTAVDQNAYDLKLYLDLTNPFVEI